MICHAAFHRSGVKPQSNQRGIETPEPPDEKGIVVEPQSNQRGIETEA